MIISIKKALLLSAGLCAMIAAAGCTGGFGGNSAKDVKNAINTLSEQFGTDFELRSKKNTGGAVCNFTVTCSETGDKEISVFQYDKKHQVKTDYMFVRYGDDAYDMIRKAAEKTEKDCKVLVSDLAVNHYPNVKYDASSDLAAYLAENDFVIEVVIPEKLDNDGLIAEYKKLALSLRSCGINCKTLTLACADSKADFDALIPPDHIPHKRERDVPSTGASFSTYISAIYRSLYEYCDDPDNIGDVLIIADGVTVKKI